MSIRGGRWEAYARGPRPAGGRLLAAVVIVLAVVGLLGWALAHPNAGWACGPQISFGSGQPGFHRIAGTPQRAVRRLPVRVRLATVLGSPRGVYRGGHGALILYGPRSRDGVFRLTARPLASGFDAAAIRLQASECDVCDENRLVPLAPGVRGALMAGGNGPNSVSWIENGLIMVVLGPSSSFDATGAIAAARAVARANMR